MFRKQRVTDAKIREKLTQILSVLDEYLGDTDPDFTDCSDEEIQEEDPVFWSVKELANLLR